MAAKRKVVIRQSRDGICFVICPICNSSIEGKRHEILSETKKVTLPDVDYYDFTCNDHHCNFQKTLPLMTSEKNVFRISPCRSRIKLS